MQSMPEPRTVQVIRARHGTEGLAAAALETMQGHLGEADFLEQILNLLKCAAKV